MAEYISTGIFKSAQPLSAADQKGFRSLFDNDPGVEKVTVSEKEIAVEYNIYLYTEQQILALLIGKEFIIKKNKKTGFIKRQIEYLAKSNYKNYGNRKPDCC